MTSLAGFFFSQKVDSIQIVFDNQQLVLPGESFRIGIVSYYKNGKSQKNHRHCWEVQSGGGNIKLMLLAERMSQAVRLQLVKNSFRRKENTLTLKLIRENNQNLVRELLLPLNYETKIAYRPTGNFDKSPGSQITGEVISEFNNGIVRVCDDWRNNKESENFIFSGKGGYWKNGKFTIDPDFMKIENHHANLIINSLRNTSVADTFSVQLDYKHAYDLTF